MIEVLHTGMAFAVVSGKAGLGRAGIGGMRAGCQGSHLWGFFPPSEQDVWEKRRLCLVFLGKGRLLATRDDKLLGRLSQGGTTPCRFTDRCKQ